MNGKKGGGPAGRGRGAAKKGAGGRAQRGGGGNAQKAGGPARLRRGATKKGVGGRAQRGGGGNAQKGAGPARPGREGTKKGVGGRAQRGGGGNAQKAGGPARPGRGAAKKGAGAVRAPCKGASAPRAEATPREFTLPRERIEAVAGELSDAQARKLSRYGELVLEHAQRMSLVSRHELARLDVHLIDSAALLKERELPAEPGAVTADLGTGAGLPGVVLAILRPDARVALVDSRRSRIVFLKIVLRELDLGNVEIVHERIEALAGKRSFALCVARALGRLDEVLVPSLRIVAPEGALVLYKGPRWQEERARAAQLASDAGWKLATEWSVELPGADRTTTFAEFQAVSGA